MIAKLGNCFFHYRNFLFPVFYLALFIPSSVLFENDSLSVIVGGILILLGVSIRCLTIGLVYIVRGGKNRQIFAKGLVTEGIYTICRNPMYLGNLILLMGFGVFANSALFVFVFFPLFFIIYYSIIRAEEIYLYIKFGQSYLSYKKRVNSIFPNLSLLGSAFKDVNFKWIKVLSKEHSSLYMYCLGVLVISFIKGRINLYTLSFFILVCSLIFIVVKWMKRMHKFDTKS